MEMINKIKKIIFRKRIMLEQELEMQDRQFMTLQKKYGNAEKERYILAEENAVLKENTEKYLKTIKELRKKVRDLKKEMKENV